MDARLIADRAGLIALLGTIAVLSIAAIVPQGGGVAWPPGEEATAGAPRRLFERDAALEPAPGIPPRHLTPEELDHAARLAGWPNIDGWWPEMRQIIVDVECPSLNTHCFNPFDPHGGSHGLAQLNGEQHFLACGEDFAQRYDPIVNLRTALCVRAIRGRFGGPGGWSGADQLGIH